MKEEIETTKLQPNSPAQNKESKTWMIVTAVILLGLFAFVWIFMVEDTEGIIDRDTTICIAENAEFYGVDWCRYCTKQKELFGTNVGLLTYIDCELDRDACIAADIKVFPTWIINGEVHTGLIYEEELKELTGC